MPGENALVNLQLFVKFGIQLLLRLNDNYF